MKIPEQVTESDLIAANADSPGQLYPDWKWLDVTVAGGEQTWLRGLRNGLPHCETCRCLS